MSKEEEMAFLDPFLDRASAGEVLEIGEIHQAYADQLGRSVHRSVVYALLHRHGWRKVAPRPVHPKHNAQAAKSFKKIRRPSGNSQKQSPTTTGAKTKIFHIGDQSTTRNTNATTTKIKG